MNLSEYLTQEVKHAFVQAGFPEDTDPMLNVANDPRNWDFQANGVMKVAKNLGINPRPAAEKIAQILQSSAAVETVSAAGPGFLNIRISQEWLSTRLSHIAVDHARLVTKSSSPDTVIVDYSSPNLAKEMHVGHLRSTIIGDAVARVLAYLGHRVIRQNHIGDWGTQFGMLLAFLDSLSAEAMPLETHLADLEAFYRQAKKRFDEDPEFAEKSRAFVVRLQSGDAALREAWKQFIKISLQHCSELYNKLNVALTPDDVRGESFYNEQLVGIVAELMEKGIAVSDAGACIVFLEEQSDRNGDSSVVIVKKSDGGYPYMTTDLAALRYRSKVLKADRILAFTDHRQNLHFEQLGKIGRAAGLLNENTVLDHCSFGSMLGENGEPFQTRTGHTVKLSDLLDEAVKRAQVLVCDKNPEMAQEQLNEIAEKVGIGAIKYADLSKNRTSNYVFSWDGMLSFEGATAPYLQYANTRIQGVLRKANPDSSSNGAIRVVTSEEKALGMNLLKFEETLLLVSRKAAPHFLCAYLYSIAGDFMRFYENCTVLSESLEKEVQHSRLALCKLTSHVLTQGLALLGIASMDRM